MGLNFDFLGLGVTFGGRDKGLHREQGLAARGFTAIQESLSTLADASPFERLGAGVQSMSDHVGSVINQVRGLTDGVNLTTGYEAHMQALGVESRRLGANLGYAGNQLDRFSSRAAGLADGLNTSATTAAEAIDAVARGGEGLRIVGLRSQADAVRFQASFGGLQELSASIHQLRTEYALTDEQVQQVIGSTTAMGRATGNVSGAFQGLGDVLGALRQRASLEGTTLDSSALASSAAQVQGLAAGFYQMTHNADEARRMALDVFQSQLGARQNWQNMFAGTADDVGDFVTHMSIAQGDVNQAFEQMRQGPAEFTRGIIQMYRTAKSRGPVTAEQFNFLRAQMERALGPQSAQLMVNFMRTADDATLETMSTVQNATANLGQMAREAHRTGRTLQQEFDRIKDAGTTAFRSIGRGEAVQMVRDTSREFGVFNHAMRDVVDRGGPMASFVERLSAIHQIGALALIPSTLRPMAVLFGHLSEQLTPVVTALGAMGLRVSMLLNPYALLIAAVGFLVLNFFELFVRTRSLEDSFSKLQDRIIGWAQTLWGAVSRYTDLLLTFLDDWSKRANEWAQRFDWMTFFATWINRALGAVRSASGGLQDLGNIIFTEIGNLFSGRRAETRLGRFIQNMGGVASAMLRGLGAALSRLDWGTIAHMALYGLFDAMLGPVLGTAVAMMPWRRLGDAISSGLTDAMAYVEGGGLERWLTTTFHNARDFIAREWPAVEAQLVALARQVPGKIAEFMGRGSEIADRVTVAIRHAVEAGTRWLDTHRDEIVAAISAVGSRVLLAIGWLVKTALQALWQYITHLPTHLGNMVDMLEALIDNALAVAVTLVEGIVESIRQALVRAFPQYADTINSVMGTLRTLYRYVYDNIYRGVIQHVFTTFRDAVLSVRDTFRLLAGQASEAAETVAHPWEQLKGWFLSTWQAIRAGFSEAMDESRVAYGRFQLRVDEGVAYVRGLFDSVSASVRAGIGGAMEWITAKWETFKNKVREGVDQIAGFLRSVFGGGGEVAASTAQAAGAQRVVAAQAQSIMQDTTRSVSGGIVSGLVAAFRSGFDVVLRGLVSFKDRFVDLFGRFSRTLSDKVAEAMGAVRSAIDQALRGIESSLTSLSSRFSALLSTATTLAALTMAASPPPGTPGAVGPSVRPLDHPTTQEDLRQAIHQPQWYGHYARVFDAHMTRLTAAVERNARAQPIGGRRTDGAGPTDAAQRRVEEGVQAGR